MGPWQRERGDALTAPRISSKGSSNVRCCNDSFSRQQRANSNIYTGTHAPTIRIEAFFSLSVASWKHASMYIYIYIYVSERSSKGRVRLRQEKESDELRSLVNTFYNCITSEMHSPTPCTRIARVCLHLVISASFCLHTHTLDLSKRGKARRSNNCVKSTEWPRRCQRQYNTSERERGGEGRESGGNERCHGGKHYAAPCREGNIRMRGNGL